MKSLFLLLIFFGSVFGSVTAMASNSGYSRSPSQIEERGLLEESEGITTVNPNVAEGNKTNQLATSMCQMILLLNGRIGRAIAVIAILTLAVLFMMGKLSVTVFITFVVGMGLLFGAKTVALALLPNYVKVKESDRGLVKKSPDELIREVCPELR